MKERTFRLGFSSRMRSVARMPAVVVSISMSMRMRSQAVERARASISFPLPALPATVMSGCWFRMPHRSSRRRSKSSATRMRIISPPPLV